jgi:hypothetical protein
VKVREMPRIIIKIGAKIQIGMIPLTVRWISIMKFAMPNAGAITPHPCLA